MSDEVPQFLGRYRILRRLGAGGMAEVFLAKSTGAEGIEKTLVVKRILPTHAERPRFIGMFVDEAKVVMRLNHPNVVQVYAFEQIRGEFLLAMEFVDGVDLSQVLTAARRSGQRMSYSLAAFIVSEVGKGLDYAHNRKDEQGVPLEIVHRDVSPQNILVSYDGSAKVADFGIALARMVQESAGVVKGKFSYMSPEQARGEALDRRSDVFSLGVMLAEMLMNQPMYPGVQGPDILAQVREGRVTLPSEVVFDVPPELDAIVERALKLNPDERYQTCREMYRDLFAWLHQQEDVVDSTTLERFLLDVVPRSPTTQDADVRGAEHNTALTIFAGMPSQKVFQEQHNIVVLSVNLERNSGQERGGLSQDQRDAPSTRLSQVLENLAFKFDAVLIRLESGDRLRFRFLLGLRRAGLDDSLEAIRLSIDAKDAIEAATDEWGPDVWTVRQGLSRGAARVGTFEGRLHYESDGAVFDIADALASAARTGEVMVSGEVFRLARRAYAFEQPRSLMVNLEGNAKAIRTYPLRGLRSQDQRLEDAEKLTREIGLFGRVSETQLLIQAYEEVVTQRKSQMIAVVGELGIGKTAFVAAAIGQMNPKPRLVHVDCTHGQNEQAFASVSSILRDLAKLSDGDPADVVRGRLREVILESVPSERRASALNALEPLLLRDEAGRSDDADRSVQIGIAIRALLAGIARQMPVVVWVDSVQFMDRASFVLMRRLLAQQYDVPLLTIVAGRDSSEFDDFSRNASRIELHELPAADRLRLLAHHLHAELSPELIAAIDERAGGNPFFLIELVESLRERGALVISEEDGRLIAKSTETPWALPATIEDTLLARVSAVEGEEKRVLQSLAVLGPHLREHDLGIFLGTDVQASLQGLLGKGLLVRRSQNVVELRSPLLRHVVYQHIDLQERGRLHRRAAIYLGDRVPRAPHHAVAHHYELAGSRAEAAREYGLAARAAAQVSSNREALRLANRAIELSESSQGIADLLEWKEQTEARLGMFASQGRTLARLEALREVSGEPSQKARVSLRRLNWALRANPEGFEEQLALTQAAVTDVADAVLSSELSRVEIAYDLEQGRYRKASEALERSLGFSRSMSDRGLRVGFLLQKSELDYLMGKLSSQVSANEAWVLVRRLGIRSVEPAALFALAKASRLYGRYDDAVLLARSSLGLDRESGDRALVRDKLVFLARLHVDQGLYTEALEFVDRALFASSRIEEEGALALARLEAARVEIARNVPSVERVYQILSPMPSFEKSNLLEVGGAAGDLQRAKVLLAIQARLHRGLTTEEGTKRGARDLAPQEIGALEKLVRYGETSGDYEVWFKAVLWSAVASHDPNDDSKRRLEDLATKVEKGFAIALFAAELKQARTILEQGLPSPTLERILERLEARKIQAQPPSVPSALSEGN